MVDPRPISSASGMTLQGADPLWSTPYWAIPKMHHLRTNLLTLACTFSPSVLLVVSVYFLIGSKELYVVAVIAMLLGQPIAYVVARPRVMAYLYPPGRLP